MEQSESKPRRRPRISLLSLLLITAIVALLIVTAILWREVGPLRRENARLRDYAGELTISDPSKIHAIELGTDNELLWRWRVWLPPGRNYEVRYASNGITRKGFPFSRRSVEFPETGEQVVTFAIKFDPRTKKWSDQVTAGSSEGGGLTNYGGGLTHEWVEWEGNVWSEREHVGDSTRAFERDKPAVLVRQLFGKAKPEGGSIEEPAEGFVIWIEEV